MHGIHQETSVHGAALCPNEQPSCKDLHLTHNLLVSNLSAGSLLQPLTMIDGGILSASSQMLSNACDSCFGRIWPIHYFKFKYSSDEIKKWPQMQITVPLWVMQNTTLRQTTLRTRTTHSQVIKKIQKNALTCWKQRNRCKWIDRRRCRCNGRPRPPGLHYLSLLHDIIGRLCKSSLWLGVFLIIVIAIVLRQLAL